MSYSVVSFKMALAGVTLALTGGPYTSKPDGDLGVCMLPNVPKGMDCHAHVPTEDFTTPPMSHMVVAVERALRAALKGKPIYVGCTGGIGRTGTFLACMAKVAGHKDPVLYIRSEFKGHAVETKGQEMLIRSFDADSIRDRLKWAIRFAKLSRRIQGWKNVFSRT